MDFIGSLCAGPLAFRRFKVDIVVHKKIKKVLTNIRCNIALWVKSGNRGNLKCLKVNNHFALIFHRKIFISFLSDVKLTKVYDWFLGLIIYIKYLRSYFKKHERGVCEVWNFVCWPISSRRAKNLKITFFSEAPFMGQISAKYFLRLIVRKYL